MGRSREHELRACPEWVIKIDGFLRSPRVSYNRPAQSLLKWPDTDYNSILHLIFDIHSWTKYLSVFITATAGTWSPMRNAHQGFPWRLGGNEPDQDP